MKIAEYYKFCVILETKINKNRTKTTSGNTRVCSLVFFSHFLRFGLHFGSLWAPFWLHFGHFGPSKRQMFSLRHARGVHRSTLAPFWLQLASILESFWLNFKRFRAFCRWFRDVLSSPAQTSAFQPPASPVSQRPRRDSRSVNNARGLSPSVVKCISINNRTQTGNNS